MSDAITLKRQDLDKLVAMKQTSDSECNAILSEMEQHKLEYSKVEKVRPNWIKRTSGAIKREAPGQSPTPPPPADPFKPPKKFSSSMYLQCSIYCD